MARGLLIGAVITKASILPINDQTHDSTISLISADAERICSDIRNMYEVWANVIELGLAVYLLARQLGIITIVPVVIAAGTASLPFCPVLIETTD